tara:strand:+ start:911 stop:1150 length:240 start_codon:yes stop_codon:yes gene_type:complete
MKKIKNKIQEKLSLIEKDKLLHYFYGSIIAFICALFFKPIIVISIVLVISLLKEILDNKLSVLDIIFTVLPALFIALIN